MDQTIANAAVAEEKKQVVIVVMSGNMLLNFAGPADVFNHANKCLAEAGHGERYNVVIASPNSSKKVSAASGVQILCSCSVLDINTPIDTLIIAGNNFTELNNPANADFYNWLSKIDQQQARRIGSVCGGAFSLAKAGLLDGKKATTHWDLAARLKENYPLVQVDSNAFFMNDGHIYTSGGVSSGIDLSLALVEEDFGKDIAIMVARKLVFYLSRPGFQAQFGHLLPPYESGNIAEKLRGWFKDHLHEALDVVTIAEHLNMSTRNFTRVFHKQTGIPPARFIEKLRVETARKYLEDTDIPLERIAELCGLGNLVSMRRTFLRHLMTTPSDYRRTFRTALKNHLMADLLHADITN